MLTLPESFLKEEIREGFTVPSLMKRTWAAQMKMLWQLQQFFEENGLTYYAEVGTLLGAVRHKGYIPWDDDLDIAMPRRDYMRLQELHDKLPYPLRLKSSLIQDDFYQLHSVISNSRESRLTWNEERMEMYFGCPFIIGIDVFPMDYIPVNTEERRLFQLRVRMPHMMALSFDEVFSEPIVPEKINKYENDLKQLEDYFGVVFDYDAPLRIQLYRLYDRVAQTHIDRGEGLYDYIPRLVMSENPLLRSWGWYRETVELPFEFMEIRAPRLYKRALDVLYSNWKIPVYTGTEHEYPYYRTQVEYFEYIGHGDDLAGL